jgi:hypothetical protein
MTRRNAARGARDTHDFAFCSCRAHRSGHHPGGGCRFPRGNLVIEGPIQTINGSVITIYGMSIIVDVTLSNVSDFRVGSNMRVEGRWCDDDDDD